MEHLIESVRKHPCLWQLDLNEYKDNELKEAAWQEVFNECDFPSVAEIKNLWKKLRDRHRQAINAKKKSTGQEADSKPKWKYEQQMEFLIPHMKNRKQHTNIEIRNTTDIQHDDSITGDESQDSLNEVRIKRKKTIHSMLEDEQKRREKRTLERDLLRRQIIENASNQSKNETSAMEKFFLSMCDTTCQLPEYLQMRVQRQIFNVVMEAKEQHLMESNSDNSTGCLIYNFTGGTPFQLPKKNKPSLRPNSAQSCYSSPRPDFYNSSDSLQSPPPPHTINSSEQALKIVTSGIDYTDGNPVQSDDLRTTSVQPSYTSPKAEVYNSPEAMKSPPLPQVTYSAEQSLSIRNFLHDFK